MLCTTKDCRCPVDEQKQVKKKINGKFVCDVCFEMFVVVNHRDFFLNAQREYYAEVKRINRLKSGGDYPEQ